MPEVPDLSGRVVVITGGSSGIGAAAAAALARLGAAVAIVGRSPVKTQAVAAATGAAPFTCDFAQLDRVRRLAGELAAAYARIDVLANNAGLLSRRRVLTADGHELTLQVNHLAPFLLTHLLAERLGEGSKVLVTSSRMQLVGRIDRRDLAPRGDGTERTPRYRPLRVYGTTKLENVLFASELARRWGGRGVAAASFNPGTVRTDFGRRGGLAVALAYRSPIRHLLLSPAEGADTLVWLASTPAGEAWRPGGCYERRRPARSHPRARDQGLAAWLFDRSAELVGLA